MANLYASNSHNGAIVLVADDLPISFGLLGIELVGERREYYSLMLRFAILRQDYWLLQEVFSLRKETDTRDSVCCGDW